MIDLEGDVKSGKKISLDYHLSLIKPKDFVTNRLDDWFANIGLGSIENVQRLVGIKRNSLYLRARRKRQFVSMCIGLSLIESGYIDFDKELEMISAIGLNSWLITKGYKGVSELKEELSLGAVMSVYARLKANRRVFIATAMGLKIVE
jgi:hypothetical protein